MPFELAESFKNTCSMTFTSRGINSIFCSKIYTSAILTVMILVLIMVLYPGKSGTSILIIGKLGLYIFLVSMAVIFIHDGVVHSSYTNKKTDDDNKSFMNDLNEKNPIYKPDDLQVRPNTDGVYGGERGGVMGELGGAKDGGGDEVEAFLTSFGV